MLFGDVDRILNGTSSIFSAIGDQVFIVFFGIGVMYIVFKVHLPKLQKRKCARIEEYLKLITVNDMQELTEELGKMNCSLTKRVYMDENGNACVMGKNSKHTFKVEEGILVLRSEKENYKAVLERETIAACLLKHLAPYASVNAYETERTNDRLPKLKMILASVCAVCFAFLIFTVVNPELTNGYQVYIDAVKNGCPESYPTISYGRAFDSFFSNEKWEYFKSTDNQKVVEFSGNCRYEEEEVDIVVQFLLDEENNTFDVGALTMNGKEQNELVKSLFVVTVFESYGSADRIEDIQPEEENEEKKAKETESNAEEKMEEKTEEQTKEKSKKQKISNSGNKKETDVIKLNYEELYGEVLLDVAANAEECVYSLYDINKDGRKELIVSHGNSEGDFENTVYSATEDSAVFSAGSFSYNCSLYEAEDGNGIYAIYGHGGYEMATRITMNGEKVVEEELWSKDIGLDDYYSNDKPIEYAEGSDTSLLAEG